MRFISADYYDQHKAGIVAEKADRAEQRKVARVALSKVVAEETRTLQKGVKVWAPTVEAAFAFDGVQDARLLLDRPMPDIIAIRVEFVEAVRSLHASFGSGLARRGTVPHMDHRYKRKNPTRRILAFNAVQGARREMNKDVIYLENVLAKAEEAACYLAASFGYAPARSGSIPHPYIRAELYIAENGMVKGRWWDELTSE